MKKKGFTLVELLAVIAILAILVILALPNVLGMFTDAKKSTFVTEVQSIFKQAQEDFINDSFEQAGARWYCSDGVDGADGLSRTNCKKLNMTTTKEYAVATFNDGSIEYLAVVDPTYVYGVRAENGTKLVVTDITGSSVVDRSTVTTNIDMWFFRTAHKTTTSHSNSGELVPDPSGLPKNGGGQLEGVGEFTVTNEDGRLDGEE